MALERLDTHDVRQLFQAILALQNEQECFQFFEDLCTVGEIQSLAQRLAVARMLRNGATYHAIEEQTGASTATISRVKRCLHYGADGYRLILERLAENQTED
ncbi:TrpR like protein, YerC/YecD [Alicyclobacillus hesperidum URH17-3-68]|uniref:TrpR-related protein YerC/YecD n=1 Tax=Alicyclobacillus hesperidum TaxID=89784 RepID=A0A1H2QWT4_9BACL|nr:YerC/YecD family TrpR-related protein [Alicyclobacillus hesperidum]KRW92989.1 hypothetical protein SD51_01655 [Alicyclobacillus tengchongensis]EJY55481.1 TrpR like protein, YerC/YecD [Alicyclobacillus hesperidum URH17-3-68]SDW11581.1 TrpR-related protein YerC/YecD [Alicyclobacillus hesperidum]GLG00396.1 hypothetical protein Alches_04350 [Alicyclobacillus hesperidum subsp. aegles]GLV13269.1 hypothetical protein Heshes_09530 [Alicyclobacillus hesperidum]